ncbi:MAG TPA: transporter substrate-binding domain-containing protein [Gammaproteobacteria bacterium]|nr:transporter substrate-binding domain-containing protein [Gammaproteobacteria bacterium]
MNKVTRIFTLTCTLLLATLGNLVQAGDNGTSTLARIEQRGELVLGTSANMPPMTYKQPSGKVIGLDVDIARVMASALDVKLNITTMPFDELIPALQAGRIDVIISNMTITPERNRSVAFVGPYMHSGKCIITKQESLAKAEKSEDLNTPKTHIVTLQGSTSEQFIRTLLPEATVTTTDDLQKGIKMVKEDKVGGMMTDYPVCLSTLKNYPDAGFVSLFSLLNYEPIGIAVAGNDTLFINWTENFLERLDGTGTLDEIGAHWFGEFANALSGDDGKTDKADTE